MNSYKHALTTLFLTIILLIGIAFSSKKVSIVSFAYIATKRTIQTGQSASIAASDLTADADPNTPNTLDKWSAGTTSHFAGSNLAYIEFDLDCLNLKNAVQCVRDYYEANSTLAPDGGAISCNGCIITIFRN